MIQRIIPSSGELLPAIGMGTWQTFDVDQAIPDLVNVLKQLHTAGGRLIDSSPMYGRSEKIIGDITSGTVFPDDFFYATKVWTTGQQAGIQQMETSMKRMRRKTIDLMQVHNLIDWQTHLPVLRSWKDSGKIRYIGITHYTDSSHESLEKVMRSEKPDFVQFNYSIISRHAEKKLLDAAADLGVATLINRPFGEGGLFSKVQNKPLPEWAIASGMESWAAFFLTYIISHPAVTCVIPATSSPAHAMDNCRSAKGEPPDSAMRKKMVEYLESL